MRFYEEERERRALGWKIAFVASLILNIVLGGFVYLTRGGSRPARETAAVAVARPAVPTTQPAPAVPEIPAQAPEAVPAPAAPPEVAAAAAPANAPVEANAATGTAPAAATPPVPSAAPTAPVPAAPGITRTFCRKVTESLYGTFLGALPEKEAEWLSAYFTRVMVWNMNIQHDVQKGDQIRVFYQMDGPPETMVVFAMDFRSAAGKVVRAVRYKAPGDAFPRYFDASGQEIELRLKDSPIHDWEQITELFGGPRKHHGMDFKAPVGTPVYTPFDGRVVKKNWNWKFNGNCVEIEFPGKRFNGLFLHMERVEDGIEPGKAVKAGQAIGRVGNTGHVTAPHLHYQIDIDKKPVDPMKMHATFRRKLAEAELKAFRETTAPVFKQLDAITCQ